MPLTITGLGVGMCAIRMASAGALCLVSLALAAQHPPSFEVDPFWPKPLPDGWLNAQLPGVCVDSHDQVVVLDRRTITADEAQRGFQPADHILMFNRDGDLVSSWGDPDNGDIYVADGYGNRRVAVFDRNGRYLRQWGRQATLQEIKSGKGGAFAYAVHCIAISKAGLVFVCDREGDRVQVFDKQGTHIRNIWIRPDTTPPLPDACEHAQLVLCLVYPGTVWGVAFSPDDEQRFLYVMDGRNEQVHVLDRDSGEILSSFGRGGHQAGHFDYGHSLAVDSLGNVYVAETGGGRRVQRFRPVGNQARVPVRERREGRHARRRD